MSKEDKAFRALAKAQLAAAAEEMIATFERKIADYEKKLRLSKEEGQKKQQLLDRLLGPQIVEVRGGVHIPSLKWEIPETPRIKAEPGEQNINQEKEHLPE